MTYEELQKKEAERLKIENERAQELAEEIIERVHEVKRLAGGRNYCFLGATAFCCEDRSDTVCVVCQDIVAMIKGVE